MADLVDVVNAQSWELGAGDRVTLSFTASTGLWRRAIQASLIEWRLGKHSKEWFVRRCDYQPENYMAFQVEIVSNPTHLLTERNIINLIIEANPAGFALAFKESVIEFAKEVIQPAMKAAGEVLWPVAVILAVIFGMMIFRKR